MGSAAQPVPFSGGVAAACIDLEIVGVEGGREGMYLRDPIYDLSAFFFF